MTCARSSQKKSSTAATFSISALVNPFTYNAKRSLETSTLPTSVAEMGSRLRGTCGIPCFNGLKYAILSKSHGSHELANGVPGIHKGCIENIAGPVSNIRSLDWL